MSTNRHPIEQEELMAYLDGELPTDQATEALSHLDSVPLHLCFVSSST